MGSPKASWNLAAHFLLQSLAHRVQAAVGPPHFRGEKNSLGMHGLARADVYYFADALLLGRLQNIPQTFEVDEEGLVVVGIADEVNRGVNDAIHAADGLLHREGIGYIAVDHFAAVPIAV